VVAAAIRQAFDQPDRKQAGETWRRVADQLRSRWPKLAELMDDSEHDVLAYMAFPRQHRTKLHSTNPIERLNKEVKRRADVVGIFPNEASITRLIGAVLFEQNDEWQTASRYMQVEAFARSRPSPRSTTRRWTPFSASLPKPPDHDLRTSAKLHHLDGRDRDFPEIVVSCMASHRSGSSKTGAACALRSSTRTSGGNPRASFSTA
jgi:hypothetical protein